MGLTSTCSEVGAKVVDAVVRKDDTTNLAHCYVSATVDGANGSPLPVAKFVCGTPATAPEYELLIVIFRAIFCC